MATKHNRRKSIQRELKFSDLYRVTAIFFYALAVTVILFALTIVLNIPAWLAYISGLGLGIADALLWYSWRAGR